MEKIQIKCSSCGQKFAVNESYKNRMVECGSCQHRFKVDDSVILKTKKRHFPGEKKPAIASNFAKISSSSESPQTDSEVNFQPAHYADTPNVSFATPSPKRTIAIIIGSLAIILFIIIFLLGGRKGGLLQNMDDNKRLILAAFISVFGSVLILYGSRFRIKGIILALVLASGLMAMPFIFPAVLPPTAEQNLQFNPDSTPDKLDAQHESDSLESYSDAIGFSKVLHMRAKTRNPEEIKAIVLKDAERDIVTILSYLQRKLNLESPPSAYSSGRSLNGKPVILIAFKSDVSQENLINICKNFGEPLPMNDIRKKLNVIEVITDIPESPSPNTLVDQNNPDYFNANLLELFSIERSKQLKAVLRLINTNVSLGRRSDISTALANLINPQDKELSEAAIKALYKFTRPEYKLDSKVFDYAKTLSPQGKLPNVVLDYLIDKKVAGISHILAQQWSAPNGMLLWEDQMVRAKVEGEKAIIEALPKVKVNHFKSAALILKKIGTRRSIPAIRKAISRASREDANYLKATIDEIKSR